MIRKTQNLLICLLSLLSFLPFEASGAAPHPNFSGVWRLDLEASQSLDEMLKLQGVPAIKRRVMRKTVVTQSIEQSGDELKIQIDSSHKHATEDLFLDNIARPATTPEGENIMLRAFWSTDGTAAISIAEVRLKNGEAAELEMQRRLNPNSDTMFMQIIFHLEDGASERALRVFRRMEPGGHR